jgi:signal transduction histidine kinase
MKRFLQTSMSRGSLLGKLLFSTSVAITILFAITAWIVQQRASLLTRLSLEEEIQTGFRAYDALWRARADTLSSISRILSRMPDVRAAFSTGDAATIRDSAGEIWSTLSREDAIFLVCDPRGGVIASLGPDIGTESRELPFVVSAGRRFPGQSAGFQLLGGRLFQTVITPVYVSTLHEPALINVLVAGYAVDDGVAEGLSSAAGETHFEFLLAGEVVAASAGDPMRVDSPFVEQMRRPLLDVEGNPVGELRVSRSFAAAQQHVSRLRIDIFTIWAVALTAGLLLIFLLARRLLHPLAELDAAAREIAQGNYEVKLRPGAQDEIGRLANSFNLMSASLLQAREELIRQERISTIGRLSTSLVHDLRNPLAAIYGGAELLVDSDLQPGEMKRLASNIYRSSRRIQKLLVDLLQVSRNQPQHREPCRLADVVRAAVEDCRQAIDKRQAEVVIDVPEDVELCLSRSRVERVFQNLISNAVEAIPQGGRVTIAAALSQGAVSATVEDSGPGVPEHIRERLFQPFVTSGKRSGLGLGLAMARQTILDDGGDLWLDQSGPGARFRMRLPLT